MSNSTKTRQIPAKVHVAETGHGQAFLVAVSSDHADAADAAAVAYGEIAEVLGSTGKVIVHERIFGSLTVKAAVMAARHEALLARGVSSCGAVTYIQGHPPWGEGLAGVIIQAVSCTARDGDVWTITDGTVPCGRGWQGKGATLLLLQNIQALERNFDGINKRHHQALSMIERADRILREHGATYSNVVRTWFYLSDILDWYAQFNKIRTAKYAEFGIMPEDNNDRLSLPSSTAIGGHNPQGTAGVLDLLAVVGPEDRKVSVKQLRNRVQQDAFHYGSAFSRGAVIRDPDVSLIHVSGTAAIDEEGRSLYPGDARAQINCAFDKVEALIAPEGARLANTCAATVFLKRPVDAVIYLEVAAARGLGELPGVCVIADICRDELLFEIDAEIIAKQR